MTRDLGGPGARAPGAELKRWCIYEYGSVMWGSEEGMCGAATLVHAVDAVSGINGRLFTFKNSAPWHP